MAWRFLKDTATSPSPVRSTGLSRRSYPSGENEDDRAAAVGGKNKKRNDASTRTSFSSSSSSSTNTVHAPNDSPDITKRLRKELQRQQLAIDRNKMIDPLRWMSPITGPSSRSDNSCGSGRSLKAAKFLDSCLDFPANRPLGFPHLMDIWEMSEETDLRSFRIADAVATFLFHYNKALCARFFDLEAPEMAVGVMDKRDRFFVAPGPRGADETMTWYFSRDGDGEVRIEHTPSRNRVICYVGVIVESGEWGPAAVQNLDDEKDKELEVEDMELYGSYMGREMLTSQIFFPKPYLEYIIAVNGENVHPDWPREDRGSAPRAAANGIIQTNQPFETGVTKKFARLNPNKGYSIDELLEKGRSRDCAGS